MTDQLALSGVVAEVHPVDEESLDHCCTPPDVLDPVYRFWLDGIDIDPCSNEHSIVVARRRICLPEDGLAADWSAPNRRARAWMNVPFSAPTPWIERAWAMHILGVTESLILVKGDWTTQWWRSLRRGSVCLWKRRIPFRHGGKRLSAAASFPCALGYFGPDPGWFAKHFAPAGEILPPASL